MAVWIFTGNEEDVDWKAYLDAMATGSRYAQEAPQRPIFVVQIVDPDSPVPSASWRRAIAGASSRVPSHVLFILVSESLAVRAVSTALRWLRSPSYEESAVASVEEAAQLMEQRRTGARACLTRLEREARAYGRTGARTR
jgi:hypothetical protein